jgi:DNA-binding IclR family transcriptional regulator
MTYETMDACAAMVLATAIEDLSRKTGMPKSTVRRELLESEAYACLMDFDSGLWGLGPDYFLEYHEKSKAS